MSPASVAVIGASRHRHKFGNKCVRAVQHRGYRVYPVNPYASEIGGLPDEEERTVEQLLGVHGAASDPSTGERNLGCGSLVGDLARDA